jgi:integrase
MRLTNRTIAKLPVPARGNRVSYDDEIGGFGCRVTAAGGRAFVLNYYRRSDGRERRFTIGGWPEWSAAAAREEAKRLKRDIDGGADPVGAYQESRAAPTIVDLCARFEQDYIPRKRPSTQRVYRQQIAADVLPAFGKAKVAAVSHSDVDAFHHRLSARAPTHANRTLAVLSKMFSLAIRWGWRTDNPCKGIERNAEEKRHRYLSAAELTRLSAALAKLDDVSAANAVRLLLLTGARRGELLAAQWSDVDLEAGIWVKPAATTKQAALHRVPLSAAAVQLLTEMRAHADEDAEWIFPARGGGHRQHINAAWDILRNAAGVPDARLHDLRHTYASVLASAGQSLSVIGALLGHSVPTTTSRYTHLFDDPLRAATERASAILTGAKPAEVVTLEHRRGRR